MISLSAEYTGDENTEKYVRGISLLPASCLARIAKAAHEMGYRAAARAVIQTIESKLYN